MNELDKKAVLKVRGLTKRFHEGRIDLTELHGVDLDVHAGETLAIVGSSGSGKSTLLHLLGALDKPDSGDVTINNINVFALPGKKQAQFRNQHIGFVFQFHHLMTEFTALENVMMPCQISGLSNLDSELMSKKLLTLLGLQQRWGHYPNELSGGEQQRVAIARALVMSPAILFADEPTGNLDSVNGMKIQDLFFELKEKLKLTLIVVTHDREFAKRFPRIISLKDGQWT